MMNNLFLRAFGALALFAVAACGPAPEPTLSAEDLQNTALPLAMTSIGLTMQAMVTPTPIPPTATVTFTPAPSATFLPTLSPVSPTPPAPTLSPCGGPVPPAAQGEKVSVRFVNKSGGSVNLAFGMNSPNALGECGTYSFSFGPDDSQVVQILAGCYWAYGWVQGAKPSTAQSIENLCLTDTTQTRGISIGTEVIGFD